MAQWIMELDAGGCMPDNQFGCKNRVKGEEKNSHSCDLPRILWHVCVRTYTYRPQKTLNII